MRRAAMLKPLKKLQQSGERTPTLEDQTSIEAVLASIEFILTSIEVGIEELPSAKPMTPYTIF